MKYFENNKKDTVIFSRSDHDCSTLLRTIIKNYDLFNFLSPFTSKNLIATSTVFEGSVDNPIEIIIEIPIPGSRAEERYTVSSRSLPVTFDDLVANSTVSERIVDYAIEVIVEIPVPGGRTEDRYAISSYSVPVPLIIWSPLPPYLNELSTMPSRL